MSGGGFSRNRRAGAVLALTLGITGAASPAPAQGLPQHMVAYMAGPANPDQLQCPDGWTEAPYAQGRVILGTTDGSKVQMLAGTPMSDAQPPQLDHAFTVTGTVASQSNSSAPTEGSIARAAGGEVSSSGTTQEAQTLLPFIQFLVCEQTADPSPDTAPDSTVAFFNAQTCPESWGPLAQADGRFLLPAFVGIKPGYDSGTVWDPANPPSHTHTLSASFATQSADYEAFPSNWVEFAQPGDDTVTGTAAAAGPVLPFVSLLVCEKGGIGNSEGVPLGTMILVGAEDCPDGWGVTTGANGRFVVGIGGNGSQGAAFGADPITAPGPISVEHDHQFSGEVHLPASAYPGSPQVPNFGHQSYVTTAGDRYSGTSSMATTDVPYLVMQSCTYTAGQAQKGAMQPDRR